MVYHVRVSAVQEATESMAATIAELRQRAKDTAGKLASLGHVKAQLARATERVAELEPAMLELQARSLPQTSL